MYCVCTSHGTSCNMSAAPVLCSYHWRTPSTVPYKKATEFTLMKLHRSSVGRAMGRGAVLRWVGVGEAILRWEHVDAQFRRQQQVQTPSAEAPLEGWHHRGSNMHFRASGPAVNRSNVAPTAATSTSNRGLKARSSLVADKGSHQSVLAPRPKDFSMVWDIPTSQTITHLSADLMAPLQRDKR